MRKTSGADTALATWVIGSILFGMFHALKASRELLAMAARAVIAWRHRNPPAPVREKTMRELLADQQSRFAQSLPSRLDPGAIVRFAYANAKGEFMPRRVRLQSLNGDHLNGICLASNAFKTFRLDRIQGGIVNESSGEYLEP